MGIFKKVKKAFKSAIKHPFATIAGIGLSAAIPGIGGTLFGSAASHLLSGGGGGGGNGSGGALPGYPDVDEQNVSDTADLHAVEKMAGSTLLGPQSDVTADGENGLMSGELFRRKKLRGYLG